MHKKIFLSAVVCAILLPVTLLSAHDANAAENKGIFITPPREYLNTAAGKTKSDTFTVGNLNDTPVQITLSFKQFSLADYTYDYRFNVPKEDWITFSKTQITLAPKTTEKINYSIIVPPNAIPGGHYFTLFAAANLGTGKQVRTALVLYVTVDGMLQKRSEIESSTVPPVIFGGSIPIQMNVKNTGNTHFFIYLSSTLSGWFSDMKGSEVAHLLLPQTIRATKITIPAPILPGIYKVSYGYRDEDKNLQTKEKYIAYIPIWFLAIAGGAAWIALVLFKRRKRLQK